mgnify:CR=1 FL=1|tara:strand:+ start:943 stop:1197 length:255 start_codon:yes stop_codon:yes gene_type:complete
MEGGSDPISLLLTGGGSAGTGAVLAYMLMNKFKNGNGNGSESNDAVIGQLKDVANKLDETNHLLQELLRAQARMEGSLSHISQR